MNDEHNQIKIERFVHLLPELKKIAISYLGKRGPGHTLCPTALVNETFAAYIERNVPIGSSIEQSKYILAKLIWRVMVDYFRSRNRQKHGGHLKRTTLVTDIGSGPHAVVDLLELQDAFDTLELKLGSRKRDAAEMILIAGMKSAEIGRVLGVSASTVRGDWDKASKCLASVLGLVTPSDLQPSQR